MALSEKRIPPQIHCQRHRFPSNHPKMTSSCVEPLDDRDRKMSWFPASWRHAMLGHLTNAGGMLGLANCLKTLAPGVGHAANSILIGVYTVRRENLHKPEKTLLSFHAQHFFHPGLNGVQSLARCSKTIRSPSRGTLRRYCSCKSTEADISRYS